MKRRPFDSPWVLLLPALLALGCCLVYLMQIRGQPFLEHLVANPLVYDSEADQLTAGIPRNHAFFMSPLYPAFLAMVRFFRGGRLAVLLVQGLLLSVNVGILGLIARNLASRQVALASALVAAFYWSFYYFAGELLPTTLCLSFLLAGLLLFTERSNERLSPALFPSVLGAGILLFTHATPGLRGLGKLMRGLPLPMPTGIYLGGPAMLAIFVAGVGTALIAFGRIPRLRNERNLLASGIALGVSMLIWSGTLLASAFLALSLLSREVGGWLRIGVFALGLAVPIVGSLAHNYLVSGELVPVTSSFGVNLFIGNNPASDGMDPFKIGEADRVRIEADRLGLTGMRRSDFFRGHALRYIKEDPVKWLSLMGRKLLISLGRIEVDNNADISERKSAWKWFFLPILNFGIIFPPAVLGIAYSLRRRDRTTILVLGYAGLLLVDLIFFASERFRLPAVTCLIPLACLGVERILTDAFRRRWRPVAVGMGLVAVAAMVTNIDHLGIADVEFASITINKAHVMRLSGDTDEALRLLEVALKEEPDNAGAHFQLGAIEESGGNMEGAITYYLGSLERDPFFYASYLGAKRILEGSRISASYIDRYVETIIREKDHAEIKEDIIRFVDQRQP